MKILYLVYTLVFADAVYNSSRISAEKVKDLYVIIQSKRNLGQSGLESEI
jgi:hypothetical protein